MATSTTLSLSGEVPEPLGDDELRKLVAPVALYPDVVLASLLPATTYPEQLHEAAVWVEERDGVVDEVPEDRGWDGSVQGLLQFPDVVRWTDENQPWTDTMGEAMTYQQGGVLQAIQDYRADVAEAGNLESNAFQKVERTGNDIRIAPAQPETVYVPQYDPVAATQPQAEKQGINPWIAFGGGAVVGALGAWALYSIFDDDDDDHHHHRKVKKVNNYYYYGDRNSRPRAEAWTPRKRRAVRRDRRRAAFEPKPIQHEYSEARPARRKGGHAGVRPPGTRPGTRDAVTSGREAPRKMTTHTLDSAAKGKKAKKAPGKGADKGVKQGKKGKNNSKNDKGKKKGKNR